MSIKTTPRARKSATVVVPATPAPVAEILPYAPETAPDGKAKPVVHVEQHYVDAFIRADGEVKLAAVALFRACVVHSVDRAQFGARGDAKVRASEFNSAYRVGQQFGHETARRIIDAAAEQVGDKRDNVLKSLRKAKEFGEAVKRANLKGSALSKALSKAGADACEFAEDEANFAKTVKNRGAQGVRIPKADSMAAFAPVALAALGDMLKSLGGISLKPREIAKAKELGELLGEAVDVLKSMAPKD